MNKFIVAGVLLTHIIEHSKDPHIIERQYEGESSVPTRTEGTWHIGIGYMKDGTPVKGPMDPQPEVRFSPGGLEVHTFTVYGDPKYNEFDNFFKKYIPDLDNAHIRLPHKTEYKKQ